MSTEPKYPLDSSLPFNVAARQWLDEHRRYIRPSTVAGYEKMLKVLGAFFGATPLDQIGIPEIRRFQEERKAVAGAYLINGQLSALQQILKQAGLWKHLDEFYKPLRVPPRKAGHSLTAEDEKRLREVAMSKPKWRLAGHCMIVMLSTTMGFGELRRLRRGDVDMEKRCVTVREGAKNIYRERTIPLNSSAFESMTWILDRWKKLGGSGKDDYILPHYRRRTPEERQGKGHRASRTPVDFNVPMGHVHRAFRSIRDAAGLSHFRLYDCRVQAITKLLSNPAVSPQVSKEIAGHISQAMQDRYSIQQFDTKKAALEAIESLSGDSAGQEPQQPAPPVPVVTPAPDVLLHPAVQAEIARQVTLALAMQAQLQTATAIPNQQPGSGRVILFPVRQ